MFFYSHLISLVGARSISVALLKTDLERVLACRPHHRFPLLHATSSAYLLPPLQCFVFAGCLGWIRGAIFQPIYYLWRGA